MRRRSREERVRRESRDKRRDTEKAKRERERENRRRERERMKRRMRERVLFSSLLFVSSLCFLPFGDFQSPRRRASRREGTAAECPKHTERDMRPRQTETKTERQTKTEKEKETRERN